MRWAALATTLLGGCAIAPRPTIDESHVNKTSLVDDASQAHGDPCERVFFFEHKVMDGSGRITRSGGAALEAHACVINESIATIDADHYQASIDPKHPDSVKLDLTISGQQIATTVSLPPGQPAVLSEHESGSASRVLVTVTAFESLAEMHRWMAARMGRAPDGSHTPSGP